MNHFEHFTLKNGLQVYVIEENNTSMAVINMLYDVGSRDEHPDQTGFAHLFEHLMFGGSKHVSSFDKEIQMLAGDNNAFTTPDITNYYTILPSNNIESGFRTESDRMLYLSLNQNTLDVQKAVVLEEFKQRYLNQPYGDLWFHLRSLAYKEHPYQWPTIGKSLDHIERATMEMVKDFYKQHYNPNNATLVVAGKVDCNNVKRMVEKWFGTIPAGIKKSRRLPTEPMQEASRFISVEKPVPVDAIYKVYHGPDRISSQYYDLDILSDIISRGQSSSLYMKFVKELKILSSIKTNMMSSRDPGLFYLEGKLNPGVEFEEVEEVLEMEFNKLLEGKVSEDTLLKAKNKAEAAYTFSNVELLNRAMSLAMFANMGKPELINENIDNMLEVTPDSIKSSANQYLRKTNCSTLHYKKKGNE